MEARRAACRSWAWPHDAAGRHADELLGLLKLARQCIAVWASWAAADIAAPLFLCALDGASPWAIVGHRAFDAEQAGVEIGDDQKEGFVGVGISHAIPPP